MLRLYIDPGSIKSGWALFEDGKLIQSGTVKAKPSLTPFRRLAEISRQYMALFRFRRIDEIHLELIGRSRFQQQRPMFWGVGVIGTSLSEFHNVVDDINPASWTSYCKFKKGVLGKDSPLLPYQDKVKSIDELAAIGFGLYHYWKLNK